VLFQVSFVPLSFLISRKVIVDPSVNELGNEALYIEAAGIKPRQAKTGIPGLAWYAMFPDPTSDRMALYPVLRKIWNSR
jgi:hypothetical protein